MELPEILIIVAIVLIIGAAAAYIIKAKLSGKKCIGCPDSKTCSSYSKKNGASSCSGSCHSCSSCSKCGSKEPKADSDAREE